jgi:hypothetical protein
VGRGYRGIKFRIFKANHVGWLPFFSVAAIRQNRLSDKFHKLIREVRSSTCGG